MGLLSRKTKLIRERYGNFALSSIFWDKTAVALDSGGTHLPNQTDVCDATDSWMYVLLKAPTTPKNWQVASLLPLLMLIAPSTQLGHVNTLLSVYRSAMNDKGR